MRRVLSVAVIAVMGFWISESRSLAQQARETPIRPTARSVQATSLSELRLWDAFVTDGSRSGTLRLQSVERDPMLPSRVVERFEQFYEGVRIWGADVVRDSEEGMALSIFGVLSVDLALSTNPARFSI